MKELLKYALKEEPADLLLKGGRVANVCTMEYEEADVAVKNGVIVGVGKGYEAEHVEDCGGMVLVPGFIEGHIHIESTYMVPRNFAAAFAPYGTTTAMADPHEIANTCGMEGVRFMHDESRGLPIDIFYGAPSCVPATDFETPLKALDSNDIKELLDTGVCTHLGEMMNFPGVCGGDNEVWAKLAAADGKVITGHAPGLMGAGLAAYLLGGITSDHESFTKEEALEKLRCGMFLMIRQGTTSRNLAVLAPLVRDNKMLAARCLAVSDDISPAFLRERGHLDGCVRELIAAGVDPLAALRMVTLTPADYFRLFDRGLIAPGRIADIAAVDSIEGCHVRDVWKRGVRTVADGRLVQEITPAVLSPLPGNIKTVKTPSARELEIRLPEGCKKIRVIGALPRDVVTKTLEETPTVKDGCVCADPSRGIAKIAVVEKNRGTGRTSVGFIKDFHLEKGAVAQSIAHDAHNFTCVGMDDESMAAALEKLAETGGGIVVADGGHVVDSMELPVGGLMSLLPLEDLLGEFDRLTDPAAHPGCADATAFMQLGFMSLTVIPELKITDQGYFDIANGGKKALFVK